MDNFSHTLSSYYRNYFPKRKKKKKTDKKRWLYYIRLRLTVVVTFWMVNERTKVNNNTTKLCICVLCVCLCIVYIIKLCSFSRVHSRSSLHSVEWMAILGICVYPLHQKCMPYIDDDERICGSHIHAVVTSSSAMKVILLMIVLSSSSFLVIRCSSPIAESVRGFGGHWIVAASAYVTHPEQCSIWQKLAICLALQ